MFVAEKVLLLLVISLTDKVVVIDRFHCTWNQIWISYHIPVYVYLYSSSISIVLIQEIGVFTSSNTSVGIGSLFMHISLKLHVIVVIFTKHGLTISFIPVTLLISQETEGLYLIIRGKSDLWFFSPYFIYFVGWLESFKMIKQYAMYVATFDQTS